MKVRFGYFLAGMAVASLIWFLASHHLCGTRPAPEVSEAMNIHKAAANEAMNIHKLASTWALDHNGAFPPDLQMLRSGDYGPVSDDLLAGVIEYRGNGLKTSDDGKLLLLRYRARNGYEVRVNLSGSCVARPLSTLPPPKS